MHGVSIEAAALPAGWQYRVERVRNANTRDQTGWCIDGHDLAASKLAAFRPKDRDFVRVLLAEGLIGRAELLRRLADLPTDRTGCVVPGRLALWVRGTLAELGQPAPDAGP